MSVAVPTAIVVRRAVIADVAGVAALERQCYSDPWSASAFAALPENEAVFFAVARHGADGSLAGYVIAWHVLDEAELANLAVQSEFRRLGIGAQLLDALMLDATQRATRRIYLEVRESNVAARRLYSSRGFVEVGRRKKYYRSPEEDALILRRENG